ncbi:AAA domain-containing protein [Phyllosticta capitalensis]
MKFPSEEFYKGKLVCKADIDHELENSIRTITKRIGDSFFNPMQHRIAVDVSSTLDQSRIVGSELFENTTSSFNETEAEAVVETIKALLAFVPTSVDTTVTDVKLLPERIINPEEILVITPYTGQRRLLNLMIYSQIPEARGKIAVMTTATVHSRENKIVLLSFVTNKPQDPSNVFFIARPKPLNVAITRAQEYLIMFGNFGGWWRDIKEFGLLNMTHEVVTTPPEEVVEQDITEAALAIRGVVTTPPEEVVEWDITQAALAVVQGATEVEIGVAATVEHTAEGGSALRANWNVGGT